MDTFHKICNVIKKNPSVIEYYNDALICCKHLFKANPIYAMKCTYELKMLADRGIKNELTLDDTKKELYTIIHKTLILETPYSLDSYFQALEFHRPLKEQFYLPRREKLLKVVRELEKLLISDELDELFLSMPPRVGKTTLILFAVTWQIGMHPETSNLYGTFSGLTANAFYKGVLEIITDNFTYCWQEIFPDVKFDEQKFCNAKETYLDTGRVKRYHSLTSRSIDGSLNGSCDCNGLEIGDDFISGIEEALNPIRVASVWSKVLNDFLTRAKETAKHLWVGTRWTVADPIGRRLDFLMNDPSSKHIRYKVFNVPALNDKDESNFDYKYNVGFSSAFYIAKRAEFSSTGDMASWSAQYMGEPIERSGLLYPAEDLMYFDGTLPADPATKIIAPVDVAWGGGDACCAISMVCYRDTKQRNVYEVYIPQVVYEFGDKYKSQPKICQMVYDRGIGEMQVEKNNRGEDYKIDLENKLKEKGVPCNLRCKSAPTQTTKEARIFASAPDVKLHFHFLESSKWDKDYRLFMQNVTGYTINGKNKNDDGVDCLAMGVDMLRPAQTVSFEVIARPF